jgi:hypothetical protein
VLRRYISSLWISYPLAWHARHRVSVLPSSILPSRRYSEIGLYQSVLLLDGLTMAVISPPGSWACPIGPIEFLGPALEIGVAPSLSDRVPDMGVRLSSPGENPGVGAGICSSSQMEGLNKSCMNTLEGGGSQLDLSRARALAASLSRRRIWWSSKPSNFSSNFLTSYRYVAMRESR